LINHLTLGLVAACQPVHLLVAVLGGLFGTLIGVLPGIGPVAGMAMLLPAAYALAPLPALILLAGIYCGAQCGSTMVAILVHPGQPLSLRGAADGHPEAAPGRAGAVLAATALGSVLAASLGTLALAVLAPLLSQLVLPFAPAETFALMVLGLMGAVVLASGSPLKAIAMVVLGLLLGLVGTDGPSGVVRFAFDLPELDHGIALVSIAMGVFGYGEMISNLAQPEPVRAVWGAKLRDIWLTRHDLRGLAPAALRGAAARTSLLWLLSLGIPSNAVMALMVAVMATRHILPGPQALTENPELFWGLIASLWVLSLTLLVLNLTLIGLWSRLLSTPYRWLFTAVVLIGALGAYSTHHSITDIGLLAVFGVVGYVFHTLELAPVPLLLGFVLGHRMEDLLREALLLSHGDWRVFVMRPVSAGLLLGALTLLLVVVLPAVKRLRQQAFVKA
jgi:putative tricarboxylic transport membrane protein